ncbi:hypothetical protein F5H01DRAFT_396470 [Linnemannia elongata]|nr:hypothetical protein F5H01DRAFT_396470 [Linnemannia elongata]
MSPKSDFEAALFRYIEHVLEKSSEDTAKLVLGVAELAYRALTKKGQSASVPGASDSALGGHHHLSSLETVQALLSLPTQEQSTLGQFFPVDSQPQPAVSDSPHGSQDSMSVPSTAPSLENPFDDMALLEDESMALYQEAFMDHAGSFFSLSGQNLVSRLPHQNPMANLPTLTNLPALSALPTMPRLSVPPSLATEPVLSAQPAHTPLPFSPSSESHPSATTSAIYSVNNTSSPTPFPLSPSLPCSLSPILDPPQSQSDVLDLNASQPARTYNHPSSIEFPNGAAVEKRIIEGGDSKTDPHSVGWATFLLYSHIHEFRKGRSGEKWYKVKDSEARVKRAQFDRAITACTLERQGSSFNKILEPECAPLSMAEQEPEINSKVPPPMLKVIYHKVCLGIYFCDQDPLCKYTERPMQPALKRRDALPPPAQSRCNKNGHQHNPLAYKNCDAIMAVHHACNDTTIEIHHKGFHNHLKPPPVRVPPEAKRELKKWVKLAPEQTTSKALIATDFRSAASSIHPGLAHSGRFYHYRKGIKAEQKTKTFDGIAGLLSFNTRVNKKVIAAISPDTNNGHVIIQTDAMRSRLVARDSCLMTDSIHGVITEAPYRDINITMTSGYSRPLKRTLPMVVSFLLGMSKYHYKAHFLVVFQTLWESKPTLEVFSKEFPGMTCDLSAAEQQGFVLAVRDFCNVPEPTPVNLEGIYGFCSVHFKRNAWKFSKSPDCPSEHKEYFLSTTNRLLEKLPVEEYKSITTALKERIPGPAITTWLAWYQDPCRESLIFPAMTSADTSRLAKDTNAQEGLGSAYKKTLPTDRKMTIMEAVTHCYYYMERFEGDDKLVSKGHSLSYGSKDKPVPKYVDPKYHNDGEPNLRSVPNKPERSSSFSGQDDYLSAPFSHDEISSSQAQSSSPTIQDQDDLSFSSFSQDKSSSAQSSSSISLAQSSPYRVFNQGAKKKHARGANRFPKVDKSYWDNLGIPWGIDYSHEMMVEDKDGNKSFRSFRFNATNTCPLDTTLMSWYLLTQYRAASLPANVLATIAGQCLEAVVQEIQNGNYNKARWMWYTRILGYPTDGVHNMEGSTFRNFNEHLSGLFSVTRQSIYSCSSPTCPNPVKTHRRRTAGWQLSTGSTINQAAINKSIEECIRPAEDTDGDISEAGSTLNRPSLNYQPFSLLMQVTTTSIKKCQFVTENDMTRLLAKKNFYAAEAWYLKYPAMSNVGQELEDQALSAEKELDELSGDEQVRSWSPPPFAPDTPVPPKNTNTPTPPKNTNTNTPAPIALLNDEVPPDAHELLHKRRLSDDSTGPSPTDPTEQSSPLQPPVTLPRKRPHYDIGFSKCLVAAKGPLPQCAGCHTPILRTTQRTRMVHKYVIRQSWVEGGIHSSTRSYHFQRACIERAVHQGILTVEDLKDASSVFAKDAEVTDNWIL